jgi:hypothetical protein
MYAAGWSEQVQSRTSTVMTPDTDWTKGFDVGMRAGANAQCVAPPGIANASDWSLGCQSGQMAQ